MKCEMCKHYINEAEMCNYCQFEYEPTYIDDDWDIFNLDDDFEWSHKQILYRLKAKGIDCIHADIWFDENVAYLLGCFESTTVIARALNISPHCIYGGLDNGLVIINLFQEKYRRRLFDGSEFMKVLDKYNITDPKKLDLILLNERVW